MKYCNMNEWEEKYDCMLDYELHSYLFKRGGEEKEKGGILGCINDTYIENEKGRGG